jgi:hypothetical protein
VVSYDVAMTNKPTITKSDYQLFLEAPLHLWQKKHGHLTQSPTEFEMHVMNQGYEVEGFAKEYLEKYIVNADEGEIIQFQKSFSDKQYLAITDVLIFKPKSNTYDLYEIKSSTRNKKEFVADATFQYLVVNKHVEIDHVFILHLNKDYSRYSLINLENLFIVDDITDKVQDSLIDVDIKRGDAFDVAITDSPERIQHCYKPKDCPCPDLCHPDLPEYSFYYIPRITEKKKIQLLEQGILDIKDIPSSFPLNDKQRKIVDVAKANRPHIDREAIRREFEHFEYPLYFLDYETFLSAIPLFDGYHPQQQMVFQYSIHRLDSLHGEVAHSEHLSITKDDPSISLVKQLSEDIGDTGTVFVWNKTFEVGRNKELAAIHPDYADAFDNLNDRVFDLGDFISNGLYIHPDFFGSWSIKKVLPVMVPELSYSGMDIGKGDQAMMAWWDLINDELPTHEAEKTKMALLEYCKMDTYAMVVIFMKFSKFLS